MAGDVIRQYHVFRKLVEKMLLIIGLYPLKATSKLYRFIPFFNTFIHAYIVFGMLYFIIHLRNGKMIIIISLLSILTSHSIAVVKIFCMLINCDNLLKLLKISDKYFDTLMKNPRSREVLKNFSTSWYLLWVLMISCTIVSICATFPPMINFIIESASPNKSFRYELPIRVAYPWLSRNPGISFILHWMIQTYSALSIGIMTCSIQANFCLLVFRIICEFRDMTHLHAHLEESTDQNSVIRQCINKCVLLLKYRDSIQNIFGPIILQMFISNALQLCASLFVISQLATNARNIIFFLSYAITKISESCLCAFAGSQLITESEDFKHAIYCIKWYGNKRLTSWVLIGLNQRPMSLVACHFTVISLNILVSIVNTTISYYFLLKTLQGP